MFLPSLPHSGLNLFLAAPLTLANTSVQCILDRKPGSELIEAEEGGPGPGPSPQGSEANMILRPVSKLTAYVGLAPISESDT